MAVFRLVSFLLLLLGVGLAHPGAATEQTDRVYVTGHVRRPGAYEIPKSGTVSVQQALKLAGDVTERGDVNNVTIRRRVDGKSIEIPAKLTDILQPADVVRVGSRQPRSAALAQDPNSNVVIVACQS